MLFYDTDWLELYSSSHNGIFKKNFLSKYPIVSFKMLLYRKTTDTEWRVSMDKLNISSMESTLITAYMLALLWWANYTITEGIVQRPAFSITADLKLWGWVFCTWCIKNYSLAMQMYRVKELCLCWFQYRISSCRRALWPQMPNCVK